MGNKDYIQEKSLKYHPKSTNLEGMKKIMQQMEHSVCKIYATTEIVEHVFFVYFKIQKI